MSPRGIGAYQILEAQVAITLFLKFHKANYTRRNDLSLLNGSNCLAGLLKHLSVCVSTGEKYQKLHAKGHGLDS